MADDVVISIAADEAALADVVAVSARMTPPNPVTVEELAHDLAADSTSRYLVAHLGGELAGAATIKRSSAGDQAFVMIRVVPELRRRGVGSALLERALERVRELELPGVWGRVDAKDTDSLHFAVHRGCNEVGREIAVMLDLREREPAEIAPPSGVAITSLAERPELAPGAYAVEQEALPDVPAPRPLVAAPYAVWHAHNVTAPGALPGGFALALDEGGNVIGFAALCAIPADPGAAEHLLTGVRRTWRGRGVASALKRAQIAWAAEAGYERLVTYNDEPNAGMRAINARLGYRPYSEQIFVQGLVLPGS